MRAIAGLPFVALGSREQLGANSSPGRCYLAWGLQYAVPSECDRAPPPCTIHEKAKQNNIISPRQNVACATNLTSLVYLDGYKPSLVYLDGFECLFPFLLTLLLFTLRAQERSRGHCGHVLLILLRRSQNCVRRRHQVHNARVAFFPSDGNL